MRGHTPRKAKPGRSCDHKSTAVVWFGKLGSIFKGETEGLIFFIALGM